MTTELIETKELLKRLSTSKKQINKRTLWRMRTKGLPFIKVGTEVLFDWADVVHWLKLQNKQDHEVGES